jgi:glycosyltransferase involved in cell wall biosynthesis
VDRGHLRLDGSGVKLTVFDENLIRTSPAGSCLLKVLEGVAGEVPLHIFFNRLELPDGPLVRKTKIPLPPGPVVLRTILFTLLAAATHQITKRTQDGLTVGTEGVFPFCDICYAHFCHRVFVREHRAVIGGGFFRRMARLLVQHWGALTERLAFQSARLIVVPSRGLKRELESAYPKLVAGKIQVIPNPVDLDAFARPADFAAETDGCLRLCFCALGNFERKGLRLAIEALAILNDARVRLVVVGGSPAEMQQYQTMNPQVRFVGFQDDIRPYLWASDAFLFPSAYEIFPLVCLQAAAAGLALITTNVYGVEEYMEDGVTGWTIERNPESIAAALRHALEDPERVRSMGHEVQRRVAIYSQDRFIEKWKLLLRQAG